MSTINIPHAPLLENVYEIAEYIRSHNRYSPTRYIFAGYKDTSVYILTNIDLSKANLPRGYSYYSDARGGYLRSYTDKFIVVRQAKFEL